MAIELKRNLKDDGTGIKYHFQNDRNPGAVSPAYHRKPRRAMYLMHVQAATAVRNGSWGWGGGGGRPPTTEKK